MTNDLGELLTPSEAGRMLGLSRQRIVELNNDGRLPGHRTSLGRLFERGAVEKLKLERASRKAVEVT
jgi:excisionase family DNA binding protein